MLFVYQIGVNSASRRNLTPPVTSYSNTNGMGDRRATMSVSSNRTLAGGGPNLNNIIDSFQDNTTSGPFFSVADETGLWIQFDFGSAVYIDEIKFHKQNTALNGNWYYEASNNASSWVDVSTADFSPAAAILVTTTCLPPDPAGYRYYRFSYRSGSPFNNPRFYEYEFKIAAGAV